jgi:hypothetical protein
MPKFLILYRSPVSARDQIANATPEQRQAGMQAWMDWGARAGEAIVDFGAPLDDAEPIGSAAGSPGSDVCGFSILQADSEAEAAALLADHPHLDTGDGSSIELLEFLPVPGA